MLEHKVKDALELVGIRAIITDFCMDEADGNVDIVGTDLSIQVGEDYLILTQHSVAAEPEDYWVKHIKDTTLERVAADVGSLVKRTG